MLIHLWFFTCHTHSDHNLHHHNRNPTCRIAHGGGSGNNTRLVVVRRSRDHQGRRTRMVRMGHPNNSLMCHADDGSLEVSTELIPRSVWTFRVFLSPLQRAAAVAPDTVCCPWVVGEREKNGLYAGMGIGSWEKQYKSFSPLLGLGIEFQNASVLPLATLQGAQTTPWCVVYTHRGCRLDRVFGCPLHTFGA